MNITSFLRGHLIFFKDEEWLYVDSKKPTIGNERPCGYCGIARDDNGHDGCLGELPNVQNACCGHGRVGDAYLQYHDRTEIRGEAAAKEINNIKAS